MSLTRKFYILLFNSAEAFSYLRFLNLRTYLLLHLYGVLMRQLFFSLIPQIHVCLVMEINLPTPFSDIIRFLSGTGGHGQLSPESNRHAWLKCQKARHVVHQNVDLTDN